MTENDLISQLSGLIDEISLGQLGVKKKIDNEIERYAKFRNDVLGIKDENPEENKVNAKNYAKYLLKNGTIYEKRELLQNLKSKLILKENSIYLEE